MRFYPLVAVSDICLVGVGGGGHSDSPLNDYNFTFSHRHDHTLLNKNSPPSHSQVGMSMLSSWFPAPGERKIIQLHPQEVQRSAERRLNKDSTAHFKTARSRPVSRTTTRFSENLRCSFPKINPSVWGEGLSRVLSGSRQRRQTS